MKPEVHPLQKPIRYVKGVGEKLSQLLAKKEIYTVEDALFFFPRSYEDRRKVFSVSQVRDAGSVTVVGRVQKAHPVFFTRSKRRSFEVLLEDLHNPKAVLRLKWFRKPYIWKQLKEGNGLLVRGELSYFRGEAQIVHPEIEVIGRQITPEQLAEGIVPVYSQTEGLYQKTIRKLEREVVHQYGSFLPETLSQEILDKYGWPSRKDAICELHFPRPKAAFGDLLQASSPAHQRFIYEEFFYFSLQMAVYRRRYVTRTGIAFSKPERSWQLFRENLAFRFTDSQKKVLKEILGDMQSSQVMYRMLQGDVGSGKTVVSAAAALVALEAGYQVAFMAPTEVLVEQHRRNFEVWFRNIGVSCLTLTGSLSRKEKAEVLRRIKEESGVIVFGTHALFEESVVFKNLGFIVVDEQHRFGVYQRARLVEKGDGADVLVMTATPIPRTLALTLYGDLDLSVIEGKPPGRKPIVTKLYSDKNRPELNQRLHKLLEEGAQIYMVYPLIEDSEKLSRQSIQTWLPQLQEEFKDFRVEALHGRMAAEEKERILEEFKKGKVQILVSTTVIEVGVDASAARVMVVENAEVFGLSQLHQLRGRVGRGDKQSYCFLLSSSGVGRDSFQRLRALEKTEDGFRLAELDLEQRGSGEFVGTKQSGMPEFRLAVLPRDLPLLQKARADAFSLLERDPDLKSVDPVRNELERRFQGFSIT